MSSHAPQRPRIVTIGGGSGMSRVLMGLAQCDVEVSAMISMSDDGGSTAVFVQDYQMLPPGDIRQNISSLSALRGVREMMEYRFADGPFEGHPLGNFVVASMIEQHGIERAIAELEQIFHVPVQLIPGTLTRHVAVAVVDGVEIRTEEAIPYDPRLARAKTIELHTDPAVEANPRAIEAIRKADLVLIGPGNPYGTLFWNLVYKGMREALAETHARICLMANLMNPRFQFANGTIAEMIEHMERLIGNSLTDVIYHDRPIPARALAQRKEHESPMKGLGRIPGRIRKHGADLLGDVQRVVQESDRLKGRRTVIRHDPEKSARAILRLLDKSSKV